MEIDKKALWEKCAAFHGHACPGLTIGYRAALYAIELLGIEFSKDEQVACITENEPVVWMQSRLFWAVVWVKEICYSI